jgi:hypothetical protein
LHLHLHPELSLATWFPDQPLGHVPAALIVARMAGLSPSSSPTATWFVRFRIFLAGQILLSYLFVDLFRISSALASTRESVLETDRAGFFWKSIK